MELPVLRCDLGPDVALSADASDAFWGSITPVDLCDAVTGAAPVQMTRARVGRTSSELRVLFEVSDDQIHATLTQRDAPLYTEEVVEVFLDPVGDLEAYFEIELNPLNAVMDLVLRKSRSGYKKEFAWQCEGLHTAVSRTRGGWNGALAIPFASVAPRDPVAGDQWCINLFRIDRPAGLPRELSAWSCPRRPNFHTPERFGILEFH